MSTHSCLTTGIYNDETDMCYWWKLSVVVIRLVIEMVRKVVIVSAEIDCDGKSCNWEGQVSHAYLNYNNSEKLFLRHSFPDLRKWGVSFKCKENSVNMLLNSSVSRREFPMQ